MEPISGVRSDFVEPRLEKQKKLAYVARRYYLDDQKQSDIARELGVSRPLVSRMLSEARELGIVEITVHEPGAQSAGLMNRLRLSGAIQGGVLVEDGEDNDATNRLLSQGAVELLGQLGTRRLGVGWGYLIGQLVFDAMKLADKGHGVLLLTLNYAGDQLAGKQAMKLAKKAGLNVRQVVTGEEIQYDPNGEDNRRGLAGAVALYHIAAAAAREGRSLDEVAAIAQRYADCMASVTVKSTDATHPQNGMSFGDLGETGLMEIGAGQHGEGGGIRVPMMSSRDTVATVADALCRKLELKAGDRAFVMINGCGATTMMEMLVLFKDTVEFLKGKGVEVVASMVGEILTVQEAGGFQMDIAKWDEEFIRLWNTPCHTPAYSKE